MQTLRALRCFSVDAHAADAALVRFRFSRSTRRALLLLIPTLIHCYHYTRYRYTRAARLTGALLLLLFLFISYLAPWGVFDAYRAAQQIFCGVQGRAA